MRINAHAHLLPEPSQIPSFMKDKNLFWIDDQKQFMHQGNWKRPITHPSFFLDNRLEWMEEHEIDHEVVITLSQLYANGLNQRDALDICRFQNDFHAELQSQLPGKFICGFVVQPAFLNDALAELERCVNAGLKVLCLPSHFLTADGTWKTSSDPSIDALWQLTNDYKLAVEIHPYGANDMVDLEDKYWRFHLIWMCAQTADAFHEFTLRGLYNKYPKVRTCWAHGNQAGAMAQGRREQGFNGRPDLFEDLQNPADALGAPNIFFDTLVHDVLSLELLIKRFGVNQIVAGLDNPYPLGEMDGVAESYPGKVIEDALNEGIIDEGGRSSIWNKNVKKWLSFTNV